MPHPFIHALFQLTAMHIVQLGATQDLMQGFFSPNEQTAATLATQGLVNGYYRCVPTTAAPQLARKSKLSCKSACFESNDISVAGQLCSGTPGSLSCSTSM